MRFEEEENERSQCLEGTIDIWTEAARVSFEVVGLECALIWAIWTPA